MNNASAITARNICKGFGSGDARTEVLKDVDFDARLGELLMLVGPSGCGKTTLLSILAGTLSTDRGTVDVFGEPLHTLGKQEVTKFRADNIGFIFQQYNLIPTLTCVENVSVPLRIQRKSAAVAEKKAAEMLELVGLGARMHQRPTMMSGGQQQRVAIARALVHDPRLIICDEPTAALDSENGTKVMELLRDVARKPGRCAIVVTHDTRIFKYADRMTFMEDGRIQRTEGRPKPTPSLAALPPLI